MVAPTTIRPGAVTLVLESSRTGTDPLSWVFPDEARALSMARALRNESWMLVRGAFPCANDAIAAARDGLLVCGHQPIEGIDEIAPMESFPDNDIVNETSQIIATGRESRASGIAWDDIPHD